ncbi:MAG: GNAT family N-acetyltransferase [Chloroflexi bacterium]|nr:GNAT family N-acetyltransferase [Chloroflexota bacterium]
MTTVAISRREAAVSTSVTTDRALLRAFLEHDRIYAAYALCDLDDREFPRTRWGAAWSGGSIIAIVLEYSGGSPQPLFAVGREDGVAAILRDVVRPRLAYIAALPALMPTLQARYRLDAGPQMVRMAVDRARFRPAEDPAVERLIPADAMELNRLYQLGFGAWLPPQAISEGVYYGIRVRGRLVSAAGTHVVSQAARLAVVGNVLTHADVRGRGYATAVTGAVTAELLQSCDHVVLNVRADNPPAISAYRHLGYAEHNRFEERLAHRIGSPWSELATSIRRRLSPRKEPPAR